jgi:hypothetical protein
MTTKKAKIGDIFEIKTPAGLAYVQYTHDGGHMGELVRVLPELYPNRLSDFEGMARQKELYFIFYTLNYALRAGQIEIVSHQPIPQWAKPYPMMRHRASIDPSGKAQLWRFVPSSSRLTLEELQRTPLVSELTPEQRNLSIHILRSHPAMVKELARGWTPQRAEELRIRDKAESQTNGAEQVKKKVPEDERMRHYFYFPEKSSAEKAAKWFRAQRFYC